MPDGDGFDGLLRYLDASRDTAAREYERLRRRLIRLFEWRGAAVPEELADVTLNRVAQRLQDGVHILAKDPFLYVRGVAHMVFLESLRKQRQEAAALRQVALEHRLQNQTELESRAEHEARLRCLRTCLLELSEEKRNLILRYYHADAARSDQRTEQAVALGVSRDVLRLRAHRIRSRLEECVGRCMTRS
jgi:DNA-directed RNA polymerase specialized sigma24 family protein